MAGLRSEGVDFRRLLGVNGFCSSLFRWLSWTWSLLQRHRHNATTQHVASQLSRSCYCPTRSSQERNRHSRLRYTVVQITAQHSVESKTTAAPAPTVYRLATTIVHRMKGFREHVFAVRNLLEVFDFFCTATRFFIVHRDYNRGGANSRLWALIGEQVFFCCKGIAIWCHWGIILEGFGRLVVVMTVDTVSSLAPFAQANFTTTFCFVSSCFVSSCLVSH